MLNQFILLSRQQLISKIFQLTNDNKILRSDLIKYKLMFNCYENYINFLQQIRDKNKVEYNVKESQLKERLIAFKSIKLCEIKLNIFEVKNCIQNQNQININSKGIQFYYLYKTYLSLNFLFLTQMETNLITVRVVIIMKPNLYLNQKVLNNLFIKKRDFKLN